MMEILRREAVYFWYYFDIQFRQIAGYWVLGMVLGSFISVFGKEKIHSLFAALQGKKLGVLGVIPASLIGIASPLCMYGTIPIAASFSEKGMEADWLAAFMMSSILLNPQLLFYSAALGVPALLIRFVSCFLCGCAAGLMVRLFFKGKKFFNFSGFTAPANRDTDPNPLVCFLKNLWRNTKATGLYFLIGIVLSALFQRYVPAETMAVLFGRENRGFGLLIAATIGVPLYMCGGGTIPLLMAWLSDGMIMGSATAFMITGPATKITNLGAVKIVLGINNPRRKRRGIEDFSLKSLRMRGNKSPAPPVLTAPRGGVLNPQWNKGFYFLSWLYHSICAFERVLCRLCIGIIRKSGEQKMKPIAAVRLVIDLAFTVLLLCALMYRATGDAAHEWIGISVGAVCIVVLLYNTENKWYSITHGIRCGI